MMKLLAIEDSDLMVESLRAVVPKTEVRSVATLRGAFSLLVHEKFDVVLVDLGLIDSTVEQTLRRMGEIQQVAGDAHLLVITGHDGELDPPPQCTVLRKNDRGFVDALVGALRKYAGA